MMQMPSSAKLDHLVGTAKAAVMADLHGLLTRLCDLCCLVWGALSGVVGTSGGVCAVLQPQEVGRAPG